MNNSFLHWLLGLCAGWALGLIVEELKGPSPIEMAAEYQAYRDCLENAGTIGCRMTPQDFVRYYQLKIELEIDQ